MSKGIKKTIAFLFFILAGITIGSAIAYLTKGISWLSWLSLGETVGLSTSSPAIINLIVLKIAFGFTLSVNIAQIFCVIIAIIIFSKTCKSL